MPPIMSFHPTSSRKEKETTPRGSSPSDLLRELDRMRAESEKQKQHIAEQQRQINRLHGSVAMSGIPKKSSSGSDLLKVLRKDLMEAQQKVDSIKVLLNEKLPTEAKTSRAGYLRTLPELIGPPPQRKWQDEWVQLKAESYRLSGQGEGSVEADEAYVREYDNFDKFVSQEWVQADTYALEQMGWTHERAECYTMLFTCVEALARALKDGDPCYAASTYALSETLFLQRRDADGEDPSSPSPPLPRGMRDAARAAAEKAEKELYSKLYWNRTGLYGLESREPNWEFVMEPDGTGFRGLTSSSLTHATADPQLFTEEGFMVLYNDPETGESLAGCAKHSDIICFESSADDEQGSHSAVITSLFSGDFPPNTLFRFKELKEPGTWEAPAHPGDAPVYPRQRLIIVTATYQPPRKGLGTSEDEGSKMCGIALTLSYNKREAFLKGLDDLIAKPLLTMEDEFMREMSWSDWKGRSYTLAEEWAYVKGPAKSKPNCTPGHRDQNNHGKLPEDFRTKVNEMIAQRRKEGHGVLLDEGHAFLTLDEVLAVRLYSGPAYQPLNTFLRQIAPLYDEFRATVASHPGLTFAATVGHICRAIRKLAAVTKPDEAHLKLWRSVRGELEPAFWVPDSGQMVCAVDMAFMSTSRSRDAPVGYMQSNGANVLWCLHPKPESDSGFHVGASISEISQFQQEEEVLFPPCTMLIVREKAEREKIAAKAAAQKDVAKLKRMSTESFTKVAWAHLSVEEMAEAGKKFLAVDVTPTFL